VEAHYWRCGVGPVFVFQLSQLHFLVLFCSFPSYILSFHSSLSVYLCKVLVLIWFDFLFFSFSFSFLPVLISFWLFTSFGSQISPKDISSLRMIGAFLPPFCYHLFLAYPGLLLALLHWYALLGRGIGFASPIAVDQRGEEGLGYC